MPQVWIDIEDNANCGYFPMLIFELRGNERSASSVVVGSVSGAEGPHEIVGWNDGAPDEARVARVADSGAGESIIVYGGNHGIRLRPLHSSDDWEIGAQDQFGEPYIMLATGAEVRFWD